MSMLQAELHPGSGTRVGWLQRLHIDGVLLVGLLLLSGAGLIILYSASGRNEAVMLRQLVRLAVAYGTLFVVAQIPPGLIRRWAPWLFGLGIGLLVAVLVFGDIGKGARRWLDLGFVRFQPSEMMKLTVPAMVAWYLADVRLPPSPGRIAVCGFLILLPTLLIAKQPDLGTALLIASSGFFVLFLAGISWRLLGALALLAAAALPVVWYLMHDYQRQRVLTFLHPEADPLGAGYHIIQSKIAIGSGGLYGKGWLNGTQAQLDFLPERSTDFIFAVLGEEFGLLGILVVLALYLLVLLRSLVISTQAQDSFTRLLGGSLALTFFVYLFVNTGMVTGLLPVVGLPLPLISYGGTSMVTLMAGFGMLMSIHTHRKLLPG
ncbi:MAG: rod shape-determining protein RodA [Gammaproteobacteria bacterium]|nr:MAG: rod shape-determining protein RodA [Gammaproteobacteria bacterium]